MAKKKSEGYLSAKESRRISKENRKITDEKAETEKCAGVRISDCHAGPEKCGGI